MEHYIGNELDKYINKPAVITIGNFDGLHIGHRKLINVAKNYANSLSLESIVLSFNPHPISVFKENEKFLTIVSNEEKAYLLEKMNIDKFIEYPFTKDFANIDPVVFAEEILFKNKQCKVLVLGEGFKFGSSKTGDVSLLEEIGKKYGCDIISISHENHNSIKISSSEIRKLILEKNFEEVNEFLTVPYFIMGRVLHGKKLGRKIGFPTVNVTPYENKLIPPNGLYYTKTYINNKQYFSITNIGNNPTFKNHPFVIETYIFNFDKDIYGETIKIDFYQFSRGEMQFSSISHLKNQINNDIKNARDYFNNI